MADCDLTSLIVRAKAGDSDARDELLRAVYAELRRLAARQMRGERPDHTLQPTALVHEAYLRLFDEDGVTWNDRAHLFAMAATEMRHILVDHARRHKAEKRGGGAVRVELNEALAYTEAHSDAILALDQALDRLATIKPEAARVVVMIYFGGMTKKAVAEELGWYEKKVQRHWDYAKDILEEELSPKEPPASAEAPPKR